jgi:hypothetical protein
LARNTQEFIEQSTKLHDSKYDYKYVNFIDSKHKVKIICPEHGEFEQLPGSHLRGMGCAACGKNVRKYPVEKHLKKWSKIHKNKYDYSLINEVSRNGTIEIICPEHGKFIQSVKSHSSGSGCPHCCRSLAEEKICDYFISKEIKFIPQYSFEDCKGDYKPLRFDFYIPCVNLLIEYDGEQHFMYIRGMHTDQKHFEKTQRYDKIKNDYAQSKGIELIRIRYDEDLQAALDKIRNKIDASKIKPMY